MENAVVLHQSQLPVATTGDLNGYLQQISIFPILSAEEEQHLAQRWHDSQDLAAARQLVLSQLRFVVHIARSYNGYGLPLADLIQEGNIGLMKAVKRFNPDKGVRLISFAVHWIRAEIHEYVIRNWRIVKVATTKAQRKLFFKLRSAKQRLGWFNKEEIAAVAADLGVKPQTVLEMEARLASHDTSYDAPADAGDDDQFAPAAYLASHTSDPAMQLENDDQDEFRHERLGIALTTLDERTRTIIQRRWLGDESEKATLHELAAEFGVSAERIRQLESAALKKLKTAMLA